MQDRFAPRLDILPEPQPRLWPELAGIRGEFVLYGGAAVALHLGHRQSDDFDFPAPGASTPAGSPTHWRPCAAPTIAHAALPHGDHGKVAR